MKLIDRGDTYCYLSFSTLLDENVSNTAQFFSVFSARLTTKLSPQCLVSSCEKINIGKIAAGYLNGQMFAISFSFPSST